MNKDMGSHAFRNVFARLIVRRIHAYRIQVSFAETTGQYSYDFGAFHEYLRRSPNGNRSAKIRFKLVNRTFYQSIGADPAKLPNKDVAVLMQAVAQQEKFIRDYLENKRVKEVRFFSRQLLSSPPKYS